jgi:hypothetical protein
MRSPTNHLLQCHPQICHAQMWNMQLMPFTLQSERAICFEVEGETA